jgi:hypothetical protein
MKERATINVDSETVQLVRDVSKACGMKQARLIDFAVSEWESEHCIPGTTSGDKLKELRERRMQ